jgi:hypothetical protein
LLVVLVVTLGLFLQRYGVNTVRYHNPVPECDSVLSQQECRAYGPWVRNHDLAKTKGDVDANPLAYTWQWLQSLHYRMFFAVNGPVDSHRNYPPLPLPSATAIVIAITGMGAVVFYWRQTFARRPLLVFLLLAGIVYCSLLWFDDYTQYLETGQPVAINGRYLLPILLLWAPVIGFALRAALSGYARLKILFAAAVLLLFLQGGGVLTFILRSDEMWYWQNKTVIHINNGARQVLAPFIIEGSKYY